MQLLIERADFELIKLKMAVRRSNGISIEDIKHINNYLVDALGLSTTQVLTPAKLNIIERLMEISLLKNVTLGNIQDILFKDSDIKITGHSISFFDESFSVRDNDVTKIRISEVEGLSYIKIDKDLFNDLYLGLR